MRASAVGNIESETKRDRCGRKEQTLISSLAALEGTSQ